MAETGAGSAFANPFLSASASEHGKATEECPSPNPFAASKEGPGLGNPFSAPSLNEPTSGDALSSGDMATPDPMQPQSAPPDSPIASPTPISQYEDTAAGAACAADVSPWDGFNSGGVRDDVFGGGGFGKDVGGFGDDFGAMSQTEVIFTTGIISNDFKAVAVTAEEDDLWSESFTIENTTAENQNLHSSLDAESANHGSEFFPTNTQLSSFEAHEVDQNPRAGDICSGTREADDSSHGTDFLSEVQAGLLQAGVPDPWSPRQREGNEESQRAENPVSPKGEPLQEMQGFELGLHAPTSGLPSVQECDKNQGTPLVLSPALSQDPWGPQSSPSSADQPHSSESFGASGVASRDSTPSNEPMPFGIQDSFPSNEPMPFGIQEDSQEHHEVLDIDVQSTENLEDSASPKVSTVQRQDVCDVGVLASQEPRDNGEYSRSEQDPWTLNPSLLEQQLENLESTKPQTLSQSPPQTLSQSPPLQSSSSLLPKDIDFAKPKTSSSESSPPNPLNPFTFQESASYSVSLQTESANPFLPQSPNPFQRLAEDDPFHPASKRSRSPNPFCPVEGSPNPFLLDVDPMPQEERQGTQDLNKIPDIPKFDDKGKAIKKNSRKEGSSQDCDAAGAGPAELMEEGPSNPQVISNGTDTLDVAEHDDPFDTSAGPADHTFTDDDEYDDEFEHDERMIEAEEGKDQQQGIEVEDIFRSDDVIATSDFQDVKSSEAHEHEVEDLFRDDGHHASCNDGNHGDQDADAREHDHEPTEQTEVMQDEPVIQITVIDTEKSQPLIDLGSLENRANLSTDSDIDLNADDLPFPDVSSKSDISLTWDADEEEGEEEKPLASPVPPSDAETLPVASYHGAPEEEEEAEIDAGEVAKFVESILNNSMREVCNQAGGEGGQEEGDAEFVAADFGESAPALESSRDEVPVESEIVLTTEVKLEDTHADLFSRLLEKEREMQSVSMEKPASEHAETGKSLSLDGHDEKAELHSVLPVSSGIAAPEKEEETYLTESSKADLIVKTENETVCDKMDHSFELSASENGIVDDQKDSSRDGSSPSADFIESRARKLSVPRPRDVRKDLSETRPSFFGSGSTGSSSFLSNTLPRVNVLPRISTSYRKPLTSPTSLDLPSPEKEELPTVAKPDLTKDDSQVISELGTIDLPQIETLSTEPSRSPKKAHMLPAKENTVKSSPMAPVFASRNNDLDPIILDGTSPEDIDAIFAKDPEEEEAEVKKSMGKDDVLASTRVRKVSRTTWRGQEEYQKSVDKGKIVLDEPQAASLKRYEERKKQRKEAFVGMLRKREDSTSEAESEGSQSSTTRSTPKMPDVVQSGGSQSKDGDPRVEIVKPKMNMKSVRSLWEQKAAEQEQRRRALQPIKRRPMSQGEGARSSKGINKSSDNVDGLDDSLDGNNSFYDGASDDGSVKRESLIERDIRLQKERDIEQMKERERLRSESTSSSRDESQQSEMSEGQEDQGVDIVRDTEMRRDSDDGRSSPSQSSGYMSGRSTPSTPAGDEVLKAKSGKTSSAKTPELKMSLSPTETEPQQSSYKEYQKALRSNKDGKFATFPRKKESKAESSSVSPTNSVGDVPDVIMVDGHKSTTSPDKVRKTSLVQQGIKLSQSLEKKKIATLETKPRRSLMELEIAAQREKEEAFRREQQTRKMSSSSSHSSPPTTLPSSPRDGATSPAPSSPSPSSHTDVALHISSSSSSSTATSPSSTPQGSPRKTSVSGVGAKKVYKDLNYAPQTSKKKMALAEHWEHKWK